VVQRRAGPVIDFPRERGPGLPPQNNLPLQLTSFVGREQEVADLEVRLTGEARLLPLIGPGGCGKTRLSIEEMRRSEAISLFVERANAVASSFELTEVNAPAVARVCHMLDGMPLAIELAAARVLSAEQISSRLEDSFALLTGGSRTALPRQRTLRTAIDWSYELLSEEERVLLSRLSVFAGGEPDRAPGDWEPALHAEPGAPGSGCLDAR
jgi:predicted ATPase